MSAFRDALSEAHARHKSSARRQAERRWVFVPYDQLTDAVGPLSRLAPEEAGIVVVEAPAKAGRRPYHKQKLALLLASLRHFCVEQAARGVLVVHVVGRDPDAPYGSALRAFVGEHGPVVMMQADERELRVELQPLVDEGLVEVVPHEGWVSTAADFVAGTRTSSSGARTYRMDAFYRAVRKRTGILMEAEGRPVGGKLSFDEENRKPWRGTPPAPAPLRFVPDDITREVVALVEERFADHPGRIDAEAIPASLHDAQAQWRWALTECLPSFGPYEDAMSTRSSGLFHTRISQLLNLSRLLPRDVVQDVLRANIPLPSKEGFVRQVIGWREFVRRVHEATDGFRALPSTSVLGAHEPLPPAFWPGAPSGLRCLDVVIDDVWREGYSHHITRLMVLSNLATLLGVEPRAVSDWFWSAYTDAYDWVVEPNVIAMGTFGVGDVMTTKPYVAGAAYIDRMSDYCGGCAFDPKTTCPVTPLYWQFLERNDAALAHVDRLKMPVASSRKRDPAKKARDLELLQITRRVLADGKRVDEALLGSTGARPGPFARARAPRPG